MYLHLISIIIHIQCLQFVLPGPDCSAGSACLPSTGAVCGGKQWRLHQWQHVSQSVTQLCSYNTPQILALRLCSLFFLLLSLFTPSFMSQAHDVGGSAFFCVCVSVSVCFLFWGVCGHVYSVTWTWPEVGLSYKCWRYARVPWVWEMGLHTTTQATLCLSYCDTQTRIRACIEKENTQAMWSQLPVKTVTSSAA